MRIQNEILERQRLADEKDENDRVAKEKRRMNLELKWNERVQKRQQSIGEMIERTKQIKSVKQWRQVDYQYANINKSEEEQSKERNYDHREI